MPLWAQIPDMAKHGIKNEKIHFKTRRGKMSIALYPGGPVTLEYIGHIAESQPLEQDVAALYRKNIKLYMAYKGNNHGDIAKNSCISRNIVNDAIRGYRRKNLEYHLAAEMADAIDVELEQLLTPQLLYFDPSIRCFLANEKHQACTKALIEYLENGNGAANELVKGIKQALKVKSESSSPNYKLQGRELSEEYSAVFRSHLPLFAAYAGKGFGDICRELRKDYNRYRQRLTGDRGKRLKKKEAADIAATLNAKVEQMLAPLLLDMDPAIKRFLFADPKNPKYVHALMDYVQGPDRINDLWSKIKRINKGVEIE